jgi:hypothetical protein
MVIRERQIIDFSSGSCFETMSPDNGVTNITTVPYVAAAYLPKVPIDCSVIVCHNGEQYEFDLPLFHLSAAEQEGLSTACTPRVMAIYDYNGVPVFVYSMHNPSTKVIAYGYVLNGEHYQSDIFPVFLVGPYSSYPAHDFFGSLGRDGLYSMGGMRMGVKKTVTTTTTKEP